MTKPIRDRFTNEKISRQYRYQKRKAAKGLCVRCGLQPQFENKSLCQVHYVDQRLSAIGVFTKSVQHPWNMRRRKLLAYVTGALIGAERNTTQPIISWQQVAATVERHFFADANPRWRNGGRLEKLSRWVWRWDKRLRVKGKR